MNQSRDMQSPLRNRKSPKPAELDNNQIEPTDITKERM